MNIEERVRYLLQAATRAEGEGETRIARALRRMADEARPLGMPSTRTPALVTD